MPIVGAHIVYARARSQGNLRKTLPSDGDGAVDAKKMSGTLVRRKTSQGKAKTPAEIRDTYERYVDNWKVVIEELEALKDLFAWYQENGPKASVPSGPNKGNPVDFKCAVKCLDKLLDGKLEHDKAKSSPEKPYSNDVCLTLQNLLNVLDAEFIASSGHKLAAKFKRKKAGYLQSIANLCSPQALSVTDILKIYQEKRGENVTAAVAIGTTGTVEYHKGPGSTVSSISSKRPTTVADAFARVGERGAGIAAGAGAATGVVSN